MRGARQARIELRALLVLVLGAVELMFRIKVSKTLQHYPFLVKRVPACFNVSKNPWAQWIRGNAN